MIRLASNPRKKRKRRIKHRRKITSLKRNPPKRTRGPYVIVAFVRTGKRKAKRYYFSNPGFSRDIMQAWPYPNEHQATGRARNLLHLVNPNKIYALKVERA